MSATTLTRKSQSAFIPELQDFFAKQESDNPLERKEVEDFRDRAAFVYITGSFPTHLRRFFVSLLRKATNYAHAPVALDKNSGVIKIRPEVVMQAELHHHPMVMKAREYVREGYRIQTTRGFAERRPFSRVFMYRKSNQGVHKITVKSDGSVKEGWS
jgi:hypothetical protein